LQNDNDEPSEALRNNVKVISACLSFPDLIIATADQVISHHVLSNTNLKLLAKKYSMKLGSQPFFKHNFVYITKSSLTIPSSQNTNFTM